MFRLRLEPQEKLRNCLFTVLSELFIFWRGGNRGGISKKPQLPDNQKLENVLLALPTISPITFT